MSEAEGVIKYQLDHVAAPISNTRYVAVLNHWRGVLGGLGLIGADPARYDGLGFGNLSARTTDNQFLITGSQTGNVAILTAAHYSLVTKVDLSTSAVRAEGETKPSSEALTHAAMYQADRSISFVFHVHSPDIWHAASKYDLAVTPKEVPYGTPEMAEAMKRALATEEARATGLIVMLGHEDGVVGFGRSAEEAGLRLTDALERAKS